MSNLPLKPLKWTQNNYAGIVTHTAKSPLHDYTIRYDELERAYLIGYYERMTDENGSKFFKSVDEAKQWAQSTHYRDKMQPYVVPSPTWIDVNKRLPEKHTTVLVVYHAHFDDEEVTEFDVCTAFFDGETFDAKDQLFYTKRDTTVVHWMPIPEFSEVTK